MECPPLIRLLERQVFGCTHYTGRMNEIVVELGEADVELQTIDIGVADDTIAFNIEGTIGDIDDDVLAAVSGKSLSPTEIHFEVANV